MADWVALSLAHRLEHQPGEHRVDRVAVGHFGRDEPDEILHAGQRREFIRRDSPREREHRRLDQQFLLAMEVVANRAVRQPRALGDRPGGHPPPAELGDQLRGRRHQLLPGRRGRPCPPGLSI
jgi:hypothetical protein